MRRRLLRILTASLSGTIFYLLWLVLFLLASHPGRFIEGVIWLLAPLQTGLGFFAGILFFDRLVGIKTSRPGLTLFWPLSGCALGAAAVYWFGPMLIVFSMLLMGGISVAAREYFLWKRR